MNDPAILIQQIKSKPETIEFHDVVNFIDQHYQYTPTQFSNGVNDVCVINKAGENEGSCKIFSFALLHKLNKTQTLNCFGQYYRHNVLNYPDNSDHTNIRNFMKYGWEGIVFEHAALENKNT